MTIAQPRLTAADIKLTQRELLMQEAAYLQGVSEGFQIGQNQNANAASLAVKAVLDAIRKQRTDQLIRLEENARSEGG
jgi:hypothetical protein